MSETNDGLGRETERAVRVAREAVARSRAALEQSRALMLNAQQALQDASAPALTMNDVRRPRLAEESSLPPAPEAAPAGDSAR